MKFITLALAGLLLSPTMKASTNTERMVDSLKHLRTVVIESTSPTEAVIELSRIWREYTKGTGAETPINTKAIEKLIQSLPSDWANWSEVERATFLRYHLATLASEMEGEFKYSMGLQFNRLLSSYFMLILRDENITAIEISDLKDTRAPVIFMDRRHPIEMAKILKAFGSAQSDGLVVSALKSCSELHNWNDCFIKPLEDMAASAEVVGATDLSKKIDHFIDDIKKTRFTPGLDWGKVVEKSLRDIELKRETRSFNRELLKDSIRSHLNRLGINDLGERAFGRMLNNTINDSISAMEQGNLDQARGIERRLGSLHDQWSRGGDDHAFRQGHHEPHPGTSPEQKREYTKKIGGYVFAGAVGAVGGMRGGYMGAVAGGLLGLGGAVIQDIIVSQTVDSAFDATYGKEPAKGAGNRTSPDTNNTSNSSGNNNQNSANDQKKEQAKKDDQKREQARQEEQTKADEKAKQDAKEQAKEAAKKDKPCVGKCEDVGTRGITVRPGHGDESNGYNPEQLRKTLIIEMEKVTNPGRMNNRDSGIKIGQALKNDLITTPARDHNQRSKLSAEDVEGIIMGSFESRKEQLTTPPKM
jgi:hypothetical protein